MNAPLIDADARSRAIEDSGTTLVVTAGAGTGKTTLLVDRIVELVLGRGFDLRHVVGLTFTRKAANEMRLRLRQVLDRCLDVLEGRETAPERIREVEEKVEAWMAGHQLKRDTVADRARAAVGLLDQAAIETIHQFAAHLLRLHPVESRVDPQFRIDQGEEFDRRFEKAWARWLERELAADAPRGADWLAVLERVELASLEGAARLLAGFAVPLAELEQGPDTERARDELGARLDELFGEIDRGIGTCSDLSRALAQQLREYARILQLWKDGKLFEPGLRADARKCLAKSVNEFAKTSWSPEEGRRAEDAAKAARELARSLLEADPELVGRALALLLPFAREFRRRFLEAGWVTFDGLLTLARDLVRDCRPVRARLKKAYRAILVDEFQDTDPVQYEVLFFLAEREGAEAEDIRRVRLEPGKLFIVGDPKQSIYAFRRADIEAYEQVRAQVVGGGGDVLDLSANFRSHGGITRAVNEVFSRLILPYKRLQPEYRAIHAQREPAHAAQEVELAPARHGEKTTAEAARRAQADDMSRWIAEHVGRTELPAPDGTPRRLAYRDVAVLFRSLASVHVYLETFRRAGIPYVVEGEKYFYSNQEVLDFVNLLRAVENPHDAVALAGLLRSPFAGFPDPELRAVAERGWLDYRAPVPDEAPQAERLRRLYGHLAALHAGLGRWPLERLFDEAFERTFLLEVTAAAYQGEQKLANLRKLRRLAAEMGRQGEATLKRFIALVQERIEESTEEGESPLADETLDAVKVLSIHKAKGLEFPVVFLANLQAETGKGRGKRKPCRIAYDWTERRVGIELGEVRNLGSVLMALKEQEREREEEKRVLYVAMTRARERLVLWGSAAAKPASPFGMVLEVLGKDAGDEQPGTIVLGGARISWRPVRWDGKAREPRRAEPEPAERLPDWGEFAAAWEERRERFEAAMGTGSAARAAGEGPEVDRHALQLGVVCHGVLERLEFGGSRPEAAVAELVRLELARLASGPEPPADAARLREEAEAVLRNFVRSKAFAELRKAEVLGKEVPLLVRDPATGAPVQRTLDVLYRRGDRLVIGDYKTDRVREEQAEQRAAGYAGQGKAYVEAVRSALDGMTPEFRVFFLRLGVAVPVMVR